jgi:hydroxyacylglutathione hydrolase
MYSDHAGGNARLVKKVKDVQVYGGDERIPALTHPVQDGAVFKLGTLEIQALHTPCHTTGHICYYVKGNNERVVFTGDTLFIGGCGRFFEGTAEQMLNSLDKLARLPPDTKVYCGHEYTLSNLAFAHSVDPNNKDLEEKIQFAKHTKCTVPSTIASELTYNPFMRTREIALQKATGQTDPVKVMAVLREMKNNFKG